MKYPDPKDAENCLPSDLSTLSPSFKRLRFMATNVSFDPCEEYDWFTIVVKERGPEKRWMFVGNDKGRLRYRTEKKAKREAQRLRQWAKNKTK